MARVGEHQLSRAGDSPEVLPVTTVLFLTMVSPEGDSGEEVDAMAPGRLAQRSHAGTVLDEPEAIMPSGPEGTPQGVASFMGPLHGVEECV